MTLPFHAALLERLRLIRQGADVLITGKQTSKSGRIFKGFEVSVAGDETADRPVTDHSPHLA